MRDGAPTVAWPFAVGVPAVPEPLMNEVPAVFLPSRVPVGWFPSGQAGSGVLTLLAQFLGTRQRVTMHLAQCAQDQSMQVLDFTIG